MKCQSAVEALGQLHHGIVQVTYNVSAKQLSTSCCPTACFDEEIPPPDPAVSLPDSVIRVWAPRSGEGHLVILGDRGCITTTTTTTTTTITTTTTTTTTATVLLIVSYDVLCIHLYSFMIIIALTVTHIKIQFTIYQQTLFSFIINTINITHYDHQYQQTAAHNTYAIKHRNIHQHLNKRTVLKYC